MFGIELSNPSKPFHDLLQVAIITAFRATLGKLDANRTGVGKSEILIVSAEVDCWVLVGIEQRQSGRPCHSDVVPTNTSAEEQVYSLPTIVYL